MLRMKNWLIQNINNVKRRITLKTNIIQTKQCINKLLYVHKKYKVENIKEWIKGIILHLQENDENLTLR